MNEGVVIVPLCFLADANGKSMYVVRLDFDAAGLLTRWKRVKRPESGNWYIGWFFNDDEALAVLNVGPPQLKPNPAVKVAD